MYYACWLVRLTLSELGVRTLDKSVFEKDPKNMEKFSENYYLFVAHQLQCGSIIHLKKCLGY